MPISGQHQSSRRWVKRSGISPVTVVLAVLLVIALGVIAWLLIQSGNEKPPDNPQPEQTEPVEKLTDTIDIPGYTEIIFRAGVAEQDDTILNPPQNFCWFKVSLVLEDGTVLWTSDLIAPGGESEPIVLNVPLERGIYENAMLKYQCFADEAEQKALNGAETKLTLKVG